MSTNKRKRDSPPSSPSTNPYTYYPPNPNKRSLDTADNDGSNKKTTDQNMHPNLNDLRCRRCAYFEKKNGGKSRKRRHSARSSRHRHRHRRTSRH